MLEHILCICLLHENIFSKKNYNNCHFKDNYIFRKFKVKEEFKKLSKFLLYYIRKTNKTFFIFNLFNSEFAISNNLINIVIIHYFLLISP